MVKTFKFRLYPTKKQETLLNENLEICRLLYNLFLEDRINKYKKQKKTISLYDQINKLPKLKKKHKNLTKVYSQVLQNVGVRLDLAYQSFFRRLKNKETPGFPRFKAFGRYKSMTFPEFGSGIQIKDGKLVISKIGNLDIVLHRELKGSPKTATIYKTARNKWFIYITSETGKTEEKQYKNKKSKSVGLDVGIESFLTLSNGEKIENPRFLEKETKIREKVDRQLSEARNKEDWKNYRKIKKKRARIYERITNKRHNYAHQISRQLINNKKYNYYAVEDININKLIEKNWCNKQILDVAWRMFLNNLTYKAEEAGKRVIKVNPAYTSQDCSKCGNREFKSLSERTHDCKKCGFKASRDLNAANNILTLGLQCLAKA